jgi:hypothetical protein
MTQAVAKVNKVKPMLTRAPPNPTRPSCVGALGYTLKAEYNLGGASSNGQSLEWPVAISNVPRCTVE